MFNAEFEAHNWQHKIFSKKKFEHKCGTKYAIHNVKLKLEAQNVKQNIAGQKVQHKRAAQNVFTLSLQI